jgi:hypothetical protein
VLATVAPSTPGALLNERVGVERDGSYAEGPGGTASAVRIGVV